MSLPILESATLAHAPGGMMLGMLLVAIAVGFVAGMIFERGLAGRQRRDNEE